MNSRRESSYGTTPEVPITIKESGVLGEERKADVCRMSRLHGLEVDDQFEFGCLDRWYFSQLLAFRIRHVGVFVLPSAEDAGGVGVAKDEVHQISLI
jgi:hypothetical protein